MKIRTMGYLTAIILLGAGLTAVAAENKLPPLSEEGYKELSSDFDKGRDCIYSRTINDWTTLDKASLILYAPTKKHPYYVKLIMPSHELNYAHTIGVYSRFDNRFCPYGGDALFIDGQRYTIRAIKKIDKATAKQMIAFNKKK